MSEIYGSSKEFRLNWACTEKWERQGAWWSGRGKEGQSTYCTSQLQWQVNREDVDHLLYILVRQRTEIRSVFEVGGHFFDAQVLQTVATCCMQSFQTDCALEAHKYTSAAYVMFNESHQIYLERCHNERRDGRHRQPLPPSAREGHKAVSYGR
eukprot:353182-Chlamydomonas_euryale.AAC.48